MKHLLKPLEDIDVSEWKENADDIDGTSGRRLGHATEKRKRDQTNHKAKEEEELEMFNVK